MSMQSLTMWLGHYSNAPTRQLGRDLERLSRPLKHNEHGYEETPCNEGSHRVRRFFQVLALAPVAPIGSILGFGLFSVAGMISTYYDSRLEIDDMNAEAIGKKRTFHLLSLNVCFQEGPFAPIAGGVIPPLDPVEDHPSRATAIAHWIGTQLMAPDIFLGQEFTGLAAQDAFVAELKNHGYRYFVIDRAPHPFLMNSGLIVASKYKLSNVSLTPFSYSDRYGGGKIVQNGAIHFSLTDNNKPVLSLLNVHLNAESGPDADNTRYDQLQNYVIPQLRNTDTPTVLMGDLNFDTSTPGSKEQAGLDGLINICEGENTWTNKGVVHLRGGNNPVVYESLDAIIANSTEIELLTRKISQVAIGNALLTDHYAVGVTATVRQDL